ncbi:MAG: hypothetical protein RI957_1405 [Verrucomicrobiota bacterium]|jgi:UPF0271 protein
MNRPDLNCDLGESESAETRTSLMELIDSANIACGGHAGDLESMKHSIGLAMEYDVRIGAHPGLCQEGGRGHVFPKLQELLDLLDRQVHPFRELVERSGGDLHHIKLHGTLYHATDQVPELAEAFLDWCARNLRNTRIYARSGGLTATRAETMQLPCWHECFLDRSYEADGTLRARTHANAMISHREELQSRLAQWRKSGVLMSHDEAPLQLRCDTFCLHSDGPHALEFARIARRFFSRIAMTE